MNNNITEKYVPIFLIVSSYIFGIICIKLNFYRELVQLTWFQMLLTTGVLIYVLREKNSLGFYKFLGLSYTVGFLVEIAGVNTGIIFGAYSYGEALGWKIWGTPWIIGLNWFIVTYIINQVIGKWKLQRVVHAILAGIIITFLDYIIEPNAINLGMWSWESQDIPLKNYIAWFVISFGLSYYYHTQNLPSKWISKIVLVMMILFFIV